MFKIFGFFVNCRYKLLEKCLGFSRLHLRRQIMSDRATIKVKYNHLIITQLSTNKLQYDDVDEKGQEYNICSLTILVSRRAG